MADSTKKKPSKKRRSRSKGKRSKSQKRPRKQKLLLPAEQTHSMLIKANRNKNMEPETAVFLTAVDAYVAHEIIELAGNHAVTRGSDTIDVQDIVAVVQEDEELYHLFNEFVPPPE